jgi:hypothetical protein
MRKNPPAPPNSLTPDNRVRLSIDVRPYCWGVSPTAHTLQSVPRRPLGAAMRSLQSQPILIRAADCNDRPAAVNRSSSGAVDSYGCENGHMGLIVAVDGRQNENKALRIQEIGQNKKKITGMAPGQDRSESRFPRSLLGKPLAVDGWIRAESERVRASKAPRWRTSTLVGRREFWRCEQSRFFHQQRCAYRVSVLGRMVPSPTAPLVHRPASGNRVTARMQESRP